MKNQTSPFETHAAEYDQWFDSERGSRIFSLELDCLRQAVDTANGHWLEVGVGSGRFATRWAFEWGSTLLRKWSASLLSVVLKPIWLRASDSRLKILYLMAFCWSAPSVFWMTQENAQRMSSCVE